ncbi:MAG: fatty acid desaturase family protein [Nocardioidaceae bacterium]
MTTTADAPTPLRRADRYASLYTDLSKVIRDQGLLRRRYAYYWTRIAAAVIAFALVWTVVVLLGNSWFQLICAGVLGIVIAQFGFLGHDSAHRQIFKSAAWNDWTARIFAGVFAGLSYGWWKTKHNRHHAAPNQVDKDPDIESGVLAFTPEIARSRRSSAVSGWFVRRQGWLFFPLLTLEGVNLHLSSVRALLRRDSMPHQRVEALLVIGRLVGYVVVLFLLLPAGKASAFFGVQMAIFGVFLGGAFAPNHKGMPIVPADMKVDFLRRQVMMSRNVRGGIVTDFAMGGLNYQVEHHLFPSMPRPNLHAAQPIVREYCRKHGVPYTETGLFESYGIVVRYLNRVGLRGQDTFACPLAALYRD